MIVHADSLDDDVELDADLCIVGAGAAGITIALQFLASDLRVILLEGGEAKRDGAAQSLYAGTVDRPDLHSPTDRYRERRLGGTTTTWSGRCIPYDPIDFEVRPWIADSGWPIPYADVAKWYPAATALCEAGECVYRADAAVPGGMRPLIRSFASASFDADRIERFSCPTDFGARYRARLAASGSVRLLLGANVTEVVTEADGGRVRHLRAVTLAGKRLTVAARQTVLATGGLEVPRLLLSSHSTHAAGIGNGHDLVGRFYMCHIAGTIGDLRFDVPPDHVFPGYERAEDGTYCRRRLALREDAQRRHALANGLIRLHFPDIPDPGHASGPLSALYFAKPFVGRDHGARLHNRERGALLRHAANVAREPHVTAAFLWHWLRDRTLAARKFPSVIARAGGNRFSLDYHGEQVPNRASRITLDHETDALGMRRIRVEWRHSEIDMRTPQVALELFADELRRWGHGRLAFEPGSVTHHMLRDGAYGGHHIGTARMGTTPSSGVVDTECRVHGMTNLYIAGAAVFPTSSQANPTLTVVALSLRLAATLKHAFGPATARAGERTQPKRWQPAGAAIGQP